MRLGLVLLLLAVAGIASLVLWSFTQGPEVPPVTDCLALLRESARGFPVEGKPVKILELEFDETNPKDPLRGREGIRLSLNGVQLRTEPEEKCLSLSVTEVEHSVEFQFDPPLSAGTVTLLSLEARSTSSSDRPFVFFAGPGEDIDLARSVRFDFPYDEKFHIVGVPLEKSRRWQGPISTIGLRFLYTPATLVRQPARLDIRRVTLWQTPDPLVRARLVADLTGIGGGDDGVDLIPTATLNQDRRPVLYAKPPSRYECGVVVPEEGFLDVEFGTLESSWNKPGDGVTFSISLREGDRDPVELFARSVDPKNVEADCRWFDERIELGGYGGKEVQLIFETHPGPSPGEEGDLRYDDPVWSNLDLVSGVRPTLPNFVVVCLDTLRADRLGCYGYDRPTSPGLDAFAERGVLFENAISQAPETLAAHMSLFTGLYPREHHVWDVQSLAPQLPYLLEQFRAAGYRTAALTEDGGVSPIHGFDRGFQCYLDGAPTSKRGSKRVEETFGRAASLIRRSRDRPFFLFVHTYETHTPYDPPEDVREQFCGPYAGKIQPPVSWAKMESRLLNMRQDPLSREDFKFVSDLYDAGIRHVDRELEKLFSVLDEVGIRDRTWRVVLSDHGEDFWDHFGFATHGHTLYEEMIRVPLLFEGPPGKGPQGLRVSDQVMLIDVLPTLLDLAGLPFPRERISGISLAGLLAGEKSPPRPAFSEDHTLFERLAIRTEREGVPYKLIHSPGIENDPFAAQIREFVDLDRFDGILKDWELYRLDEDPKELRNLATREPEIRGELAKRLEEFLRDHELGPVGGRAEVTDAHRKRLIALGYVQEDQAEKVRKSGSEDGEGSGRSQSEKNGDGNGDEN